ncbi:MAG TPA: DUF5666 domain-containing protein [Candidatus Limnocylindrales bacterium]|nr:DUF5666 domain-containing protein [Candidatus Limnocylindrales bacterium]
MNDQQPRSTELPTTEPVTPGAVSTGTAPVAPVAALPNPLAAQARWARIGLLGIGAAALIAVAALAIGASAAPSGILAVGTTTTSEATGSANTGGAGDLRGGPGLPGAPGGRGFGFGEISITAISGSSITLATEDGWTRTITVDDGTTFTKAGDDITLGDLAVGDNVAFRQTREDDGIWTIDAIAVILPHVGGQVTAVDGSTITIELRGGTTATVNVDSDANVVVNGDPAAVGDIKVGMILMAEGTENADGSLDATRVRAGDARLRGDRFGGRGPKGPGLFGGGGNKPHATTVPEATRGAS